MSTKVYTARAFKKLLEANGFRHNRNTGSHFIYSDGERTISINKDLNRMVAQRLIKEYNLLE